MSSLPSGTVAFLFTDIEGSTRLWEKYPQAMQLALARHDAILREAIQGHGGYVFKTIGDAFCAAFSTTREALAAALAAQRRLATEPWGETGPIRVRMAVHIGAVEARDGDYFGPPVNRVARLLASGHGGQTLLSRAGYELVRDDLPPDTQLQDLGEHRLRDLTGADHIFQIIAPDLPAEFPALKTLDARPNNLPTQPTSLIGREKEMAAVRSLLARPDVGLVTLSGPGGTGKTRLALQVAADLLVATTSDGGAPVFRDGVFFVNLAPVSNPDLVASTIAQTLGVHEESDRPLPETLRDALRDQQLLLVLDNFEQIIPAAPLVSHLLAAAPGLKIIVTSRILLRLRGEHDFPVPPLPLPDPQHPPTVEQLSQYAAVELFIQRAVSAKSDFQVTNENAPAIAEICYRLDGLPLAIELAAARIRILPPQAILTRLSNRLALLTTGPRDVPARQQTLRGAIEWSYDLLDADEQVLFRRLGVFVGGCTLEAAEAVAGDGGLILDGMEALIDKSLLRQQDDRGAEPRFAMLETLREYALERLEADGEGEVVRQAHATYFMQLAEDSELRLEGGAEQKTWLDRLEMEHDNLRAALSWSLDRGQAETALRIVGALPRFWEVRGYLSEGRRWAALALERGRDTPPPVRVKTLYKAALLAFYQGDYAEANSQLEETRSLVEPMADRPLLARILYNLGMIPSIQGQHDLARRRFEESMSIFQQLGDRTAVAKCLNELAQIAQAEGDYDGARGLYTQSLSLHRQLGNRRSVAIVLENLGLLARDAGEPAQARPLLEESLAIDRDLGDKAGIANCLTKLAQLAVDQEDPAAAHPLCEEAVGIFRQIGDKSGLSSTLSVWALVACAEGDYPAARARLVETLSLECEMDDKRAIAGCLDSVALVIASSERWAVAVHVWAAADSIRAAVAAPIPPADHALRGRYMDMARDHLGAAAFDAAWDEGAALPQGQAVDYALTYLTG